MSSADGVQKEITDVMTPQELIDRLDNVVTDLESGEMGKLMAYVAQDAIAMIRGRIIERGEDAEGKKYEPYSTKPMLAGRSSMTVSAYNNIAGSKEKRKALKWVTIGGSSGFSAYLNVSAGGSGMTNEGKGARLFELPGGYKQFRDLHGRQTGFVDFSFSNRMWANIKVVSTPTEHNSGVARIAATTPEDQAKLAGNTKRRGHILKLSKSEITYLSERINMELTQVFHKNGL